MSILSLTEIAGRELDIGEDTSRRWTQRYQAFSDTMGEDPTIVTGALAALTGIVLFRVHAIDGGCLVTGINPRQDTDNLFRWEIDVTWSSLSLSSRSANVARSDPSQRSENPLSRPPRVRVYTERFTRVVTEDLDQNAIENTAGDIYDPPAEVDVFRPAIVVSRNESSFDLDFPKDWVNRVNEDEFLGYESESVRIIDITADRAFENNTFFFEVTYTFQVSLDLWGWKVRKLNAGFRELVNGERIAIVDRSGEPPSVPVKLDEAGKKLQGGGAVWKEYRVYKSARFADLGLF